MRKKILLSAGYFILLFYIVLLAPERRAVRLSQAERLRLHPVVDSVKEMFNRHGGTWLVHLFYFFGNLFGNIVLFLPFSFIAVWVFKISNVIKIALLACLLSIVIETLQYMTGWGVADIDDVLLNTTGAIAGYYLCQFFQYKIN